MFRRRPGFDSSPAILQCLYPIYRPFSRISSTVPLYTVLAHLFPSNTLLCIFCSPPPPKKNTKSVQFFTKNTRSVCTYYYVYRVHSWSNRHKQIQITKRLSISAGRQPIPRGHIRHHVANGRGPQQFEALRSKPYDVRSASITFNLAYNRQHVG